MIVKTFVKKFKLWIFWPSYFWKKVSWFKKILSSTIVLIIQNIYWTPNQHIRMIAWSCDTEDWSNSCWNFIIICHHTNKLHLLVTELADISQSLSELFVQSIKVSIPLEWKIIVNNNLNVFFFHHTKLLWNVFERTFMSWKIFYFFIFM